MSLLISISPDLHERYYPIENGLTVRDHDPNSHPDAPHLQVLIDRVIHRSDRRVVLGGQLSGLPGAEAPQKVVCKVAHDKGGIKAMAQEADVYEHKLQALQGAIIPKFYGLFVGRSSRASVGCMVLEYCGERELRFRDISPEQKMDIFEAYSMLHDAGYHHNEFDLDHVLLSKDRSPVLIHLESVERLSCKHPPLKVRFGSVVPKMKKIGCPEIHEIGMRFGIWKPPTMRMFGKYYPISYIANPERLTKYLPKHWSDNDRFGYACGAIEDHLYYHYFDDYEAFMALGGLAAALRGRSWDAEPTDSADGTVPDTQAEIVEQ